MAFTGLMVAASAQARSVEFGPRLAISVPTGDLGDVADLGFNAAVTASIMKNRTAGIGVEFGYHRWPVPSSTNAAVDALLSHLVGTPITGSKLSLSAFQATGHVKVVPPVIGPVAPWIQIGVGVYRTNSRLRLPADTFQGAGYQVVVVDRDSDSITYEFGYLGGVGLDFVTSAGMKLGLDASYHYVSSNVDSGPSLTAFTVGVHLLR